MDVIVEAYEKGLKFRNGKFIGVLEKGEGMTWAVLSVGDGRGPLHGKEGDIIDGRYRILKIGTESIDMAYLDGRGRQTIRLTGQ